MNETEYRSEYMHLNEQPKPKGRKTAIYEVCENGEPEDYPQEYPLGEIKWYAPWRGFCFFPCRETVFDAGCLTQLCEWIAVLNQKQKAERKGENAG